MEEEGGDGGREGAVGRGGDVAGSLWRGQASRTLKDVAVFSRILCGVLQNLTI